MKNTEMFHKKLLDQLIFTCSKNIANIRTILHTHGCVFQVQNTTSELSLKLCQIHTSSQHYDLMEFFDNKANWRESEVKHGRAWKVEELRIKSNEDLHKLWFVLYKEKNMLLTMQEECKRKVELFPSEERIDKVEESMENIQTVVDERNKAFYLLETGKPGEGGAKMEAMPWGLRQWREFREHAVPPWVNVKHRIWSKIPRGGHAVDKFRKLYREQQLLRYRHYLKRRDHRRKKLKELFPDADVSEVD